MLVLDENLDAGYAIDLLPVQGSNEAVNIGVTHEGFNNGYTSSSKNTSIGNALLVCIPASKIKNVPLFVAPYTKSQ